MLKRKGEKKDRNVKKKKIIGIETS